MPRRTVRHPRSPITGAMYCENPRLTARRKSIYFAIESDRRHGHIFGRERAFMELEEALARVSEIRLQIARSEPFRGYRSATAAFSSLVAIGTAVVQPVFIPDPAAEPDRKSVV